MTVSGAQSDDAWSPARLAIAFFLLTTSLTLLMDFGNGTEMSWGMLIGSHLKSAWTWILPVMLVAYFFQYFFPATKRKPKLFFYENTVDLLHIMFNSLFYLTFFGAASAATKKFLVENTPWLLFDWASSWPIYLQSLLMLLLLDFLVYWRHRLEHRLRIIWPIHLIHHTSQRIDVLTTHRLHFLEVMLGGIIVGWAASVSGLTHDAISLGFLVYIHYNHFIHTNINIRFSSPLKYMLVSPFMHRWHHALEKEGHDKNFGVVFAWNDWIFGTAYHPEHEPKAFGLELDSPDAIGESWILQQIYPFRIWLQKTLCLITTRGQVP